MRISTNTMYQAGISRISTLQSDQSRLQQQISTGVRIMTPSDDPVGAARSLELKQAISTNSQYANNRIMVQNQVSATESTLGTISDLMLSAQATLVSAGNPTYSNEQRSYIATELRGTLDQLIGMANTRDGAGNYLFSGFQSRTPPFVKSADGATYQGDDGVQFMQVAAGRQMAANQTGKDIFQANGVDVFKSISDLATLLETPVTDQAGADALNAGLTASGTGLDAAVDNILNSRALAGTKLNELETLDTAGQDIDLQFTKNLSTMQDLDYAKAISDISKQQVILSAAQQSFIKTVGLSLFSYL
jgi:flagellar hook-associated protein 3 FlgL